MSLTDAFLPPSRAAVARRLSTICITLAVLAGVFFPSSALSGTETDVARWLTAGLLAVVGLALRFIGARPLVTPLALVALAAVAALLGAPWVAVFAAAAIVYAALASLRTRVAASGAAAADPDGGPEGDSEGDSEDDAPAYPRAEIVRENVEAVAMALVLALTVREFAFEAFQIPTGSMEPTILGVDRDRGWGDRLLASKVQLLGADPPRWSIVVFRYPLARTVNYIKRVVGLPGEKLEIRRGDIYVDGKVVSKPEVVQQSLWFPVFPAPERPYAPAESSIAGAFVADDSNAEWTLTPDAATVGVPEDGESWLRIDQTVGETDVRVGATFDVEAPGKSSALLLRAEGAGRRVVLEVGTSSARLTAPGLEWDDPDGVVGPLESGTSRLGLGVADRVVRVYVDGRVVARLPHADETNGGSRAGSAAVGVRAADVRVTDLHVDHDLQYTESHAWDIPDDGFIMLGDNTLTSRDSRAWRAHVVTLTDGREFIAEQDRLEENGSRQPNYAHSDGVHRFHDSWGVPRSFTDDEVGSVSKNASRPFARRADLIGRAFFIFYPFPPFGSWRPQILP